MPADRLQWWLLRSLGTLAALMLLAGAAYCWQQRQAADARLQTQVQLARTRVLADWLRSRVPDFAILSNADATALCTQLGTAAEGAVALYHDDGRLWGASPNAPVPADPRSSPELAAALAGQAQCAATQLPGDTARLWHAAVPILLHGSLVAVLRLSQPAEPADWLPGGLVAAGVTALLAGAALVVLVATVMGRRLRTATRRLQQGLGWLQAGELTRPLPHDDFEEFGAVSGGLNLLATDLHRQLLELTRQTRQLEALFTSMHEGLVAVDREFQLLTLNRSALRLLQLDGDPAVLRGRSLFAVLRHADLQEFIARLLQSSDPSAERELLIPRAGGDLLVLALTGVRFTYDDAGHQGALVVLRDITRVRQLENMRKEFVANVSHELKTPITSIKGYIETLTDCLPDAPEDVRRFLAVIQRQSDRLNSIIEDLLYLSRLEQGDRAVLTEIRAENVQTAVRNAVAFCQQAARAKSIIMEVEVPELVLTANHQLLEHAVYNLLDNAIKYSPDGTRVLLSARRQGERLVLTVTDHGIGIPPTDRERIFERFYRVDKSRSRNLGGTGLGLAIVKHIVRLHQGEVTVQSELGKGSVFTLALPLAGPVHGG